MSIRFALDAMLGFHKRTVSLERPDTETAYTVTVSPSNYSRNLEGPEDTVMKGREFVISRTTLEAAEFPIPPKRGDRIVDSEIGDNAITEVREMYDIGGAIIAYRVRTG